VKRTARRLVLALTLGGLLLQQAYSPASSQPARDGFAAQVAALSEPPGYFDTDNLISNEGSYLQVVPDLQQVRGGAYIGVGPDQNFSYIAATRPTVAFIVDIRRDNLLLHLLFKALFGLSRTRVEYLALLFGRPVPAKIDVWRDVTADRLVRYVDETSVDAVAFGKLGARVSAQVRSYGVPLSAEDFVTIDRFHRRFTTDGLGLRFQTIGRPPQSYYPTYRELLLARDPGGRQANYLASEQAFQFVRSLQAQDHVIPVVGDLGGTHALAAIGRLLSGRNERLATFYASNVEQYLFRNAAFPRFVDNLRRIPHDERTLIIRSVFGRWDGSSSHVQPVSLLLKAASAGRIRGYQDLIGYR
jgi:hypothetical protein